MTLEDTATVETETGADEAPAAVSVQVLPVPAHIVQVVWPRVLPMVKAALAHSAGERDPSDILDLVTSGNAVLWAITQNSALVGCCVGTAVQWPRKYIATPIIVAGEGFDDWGSELDRTLEAWARDLGCDFLEGWGRDGWSRKLPELGYRRAYTVYRKEL